MPINEIGSAEIDAKKRRLVLFSKSSGRRIMIKLGREEPFQQLLRKIEELHIPLTETKRAAYLVSN